MMMSETARWWSALAVLLAYGLMCACVLGVHRARRRRAAQAVAALATSADGHAPLLVAYASQTGQSEEIAWQTAKALASAGVPARVMALSELGLDELKQVARALFVVSTYGEGDPPDNAALFVQNVMDRSDESAALPGVQYAVLALGDSEYQHYCGFGRQLDAWLQARGAHAWSDRIEVDDGNEEALTRWRQQLGHIAGVSDLPQAWESAPYQDWTLRAKQHLNPGSLGRPTFHLSLVPPPGQPLDWEAGDLVQVLAPEEEGRPREYSIASVPHDGAVHLLVRQAVREDGRPGVVSGWLTQGVTPGATVKLRLRAHQNFRADGHGDRPLLLIGNGTGLAGLRAHLRARILRGRHRNWLVFGERQASHDFYHRDEIEAWVRARQLQLSAVFSRDQPDRPYVQDVIRQEQDQVRQWVNDGAAIYVCGSLQGMATSVHEALDEVLGPGVLTGLIEQGRYRRDVY